MVDIWQNPFWTAAILFMQISRLKLPIWNVYQTEIITVHVPEQHGTIKVRSPLMVPMTTSGPRTITHMSGNNSRGEKTGMGKSKTHFRAKVLSQTTVLEGRTFRAFKCPLFIEGWPTPSGVAQIGLRPGQDLPRNS